MDKKEEFQMLMGYAQAAGKEMHVTVKDVSEGDMLQIELDGWVYIEARDIEVVVHSIIGDKVRATSGWVVSMTALVRGGMFEPDSVDVVEDSEHEFANDAVREAMLIVCHNRITQAMDAQAEAWYAESFIKREGGQ